MNSTEKEIENESMAEVEQAFAAMTSEITFLNRTKTLRTIEIKSKNEEVAKANTLKTLRRANDGSFSYT